MIWIFQFYFQFKKFNLNFGNRLCKVNRSSSKIQPIYLNSQILIEMLNGLYYLFNNSLELDSYIAIEAISVYADEELLVDVILVSLNYVLHLNKLN